MKKKILIIFITLVLSIISLSSCGQKELTDIQKLINNIYSSEEKIAGFSESNQMLDNGFLVYAKETDYKIQRGKSTSSQVEINEKILSTTSDTLYDETVTSFKTINNVKYVQVGTNTYQNPYDVPTYYLTFVLSEDFLESGYTLTKENEDYYLKAKVKDEKISSLFLNKSLGTLSNLYIEIVVKNEKLQSFNCNYISKNGFNVTINTNYFYASSGTAKAVFHLEGGTCQSSKEKVTYLYPFNGTFLDMLIVDPNILEKDDNDKIKKDGYHIEGWYLNKVENPDGTVTYTDKWDFENNRITLEGVDLYAKWEKNVNFAYSLYYINSQGEEVKLGGYTVSEGEQFNLSFIRNQTVEGYTAVGLLDEEGNKWDESFTHPGGNDDLTIKVYLDLIEGEYAVVKKASQLKNAINQNQNIYLANDIDFDGDELSFESYSGTILGNRYKLSNYVINYDASKNSLKGELSDLDNTSKNYLYVSLFFELKDAVIKDLTFENMSVKIKTTNSFIKHIIVAPLAITVKNTHLENVIMNGKITVVETPESENIYVTDSFWWNKDTEDSSTVDDNSRLDITIE